MKTLPKSLTHEEWVKLIKAIPPKDRQAKVAFLLAYGSGLRISEVKNLQPENVKSNYIQVWGGKGGKDRTVPKPKGWKEWMFKILPIKKTTRSLERNFKSYAKKAGLDPKYVFHSLRHSFATRAVDNGIPINQVQLLLGHSNVSTTSIYTLARPKDALKSYEELF